MAFEQPAVAGKFSPRDNPQWWSPHAGGPKLFLIYTNSVTDETFTKPNGTQESSRIAHADVAIVDQPDPETGKPYTVLLDVRIGGKALVPQLSKNAGTGVATAGRMRQLPAQGEKSGAFVLDDYQPADLALLTQMDALPWRTQAPAQPAANPPAAAVTPGVSTAAVTPPPAAAPAAVAGSPWYGTPEGAVLLGKLVNANVAGAAQLDYETAKLIGAGLG